MLMDFLRKPLSFIQLRLIQPSCIFHPAARFAQNIQPPQCKRLNFIRLDSHAARSLKPTAGAADIWQAAQKALQRRRNCRRFQLIYPLFPAE
ncbi:hypothetical protein BEN74_16350 [Acinetobacter sp. WCHAc010034]|nr:hypothetical protein BEN74_16350 [Acinetobacter sp. WCHAc010034]